MNTTVTCPHCKQDVDIWLDGFSNLFDCEKCGQAFSYQISVPTPPIVQPQHLSVSHSHAHAHTHQTKPSGFSAVFRTVAYVCVSLVLLALIAFFGTAFLAGFFEGIGDVMNRQ